MIYTPRVVRQKIPSRLMISRPRNDSGNALSTLMHSLVHPFRPDIKDEDVVDDTITSETTMVSVTNLKGRYRNLSLMMKQLLFVLPGAFD